MNISHISKQTISKLLVAALVLLPLFSPASMAIALGEAEPEASLLISPDKERFLDPEHLYVDIIMDTATSSVNALNLQLSFASSSLELVASSTENNICEYTAVNETDNRTGAYELQCGFTPRAFSGTVAVSLVFKKLDTGFTKMIITKDSAILANDGLGTNILAYRDIHNIYLVK